jgi:hypothetical protein
MSDRPAFIGDCVIIKELEIIIARILLRGNLTRVRSRTADVWGSLLLETFERCPVGGATRFTPMSWICVYLVHWTDLFFGPHVQSPTGCDCSWYEGESNENRKNFFKFNLLNESGTQLYNFST